jgi:hypothetical protein
MEEGEEEKCSHTEKVIQSLINAINNVGPNVIKAAYIT